MDSGHDALLVERVRSGDTTAFAPLFERWYDRAYNVARGVVRRPELAADVTQDAFVAAWQQLDRLDDVNAFGGWLLRITRNRALDALRREGRSTAIDDDTVIALHDRGLPSPVAATASPGPAAAAEIHEQEQLLWAASAALGERDASVLDLHLRHGLTPAELAEDLGVTPNHAHQLVHRLRVRLGDAIGAFLLWNRGAPRCANLAGRIGPTFDADVTRIVKRHIRTCPECSDERERQTDPAKLFAAVPFALAPLAFRARAAFALEQAGVAMPTDLTAPASRPEPTRNDVDAPTVRIDRDGADVRAGSGDSLQVADCQPGPEHSGPEHSGAVRRGGIERRLAIAAAAAMVLLGCGALLVLSTTSSPKGASSAVAPPPSTVLAAPTTTVPDTSTPDTSTTTSTTSTTTTAPAPTTTTVPEPPLAVPPAPPSDDSEPPPPAPPVAEPPPPAPPPAQPDPLPPNPPPPSPDSTVPPPPPPPPAPPTIQRLTFAGANQSCSSPMLPATVAWITDGADSAELRWNGQTASVPVDGDRAICLEPGDQVVLVARNSGGEVSQTLLF